MLLRLEKWLLTLSMLSLLCLGGLITASVLARAVFNSNIPDVVVIVQELMVATIVLPLAAATSARAHIVVEFISKRLPFRWVNVLVVFGYIVGLLALLPLIYAGGREALHSLGNGAFYFGELSLPKWPGRVLFVLGITVCWLRLLWIVIADIKLMRAGVDILEHAEKVKI